MARRRVFPNGVPATPVADVEFVPAGASAELVTLESREETADLRGAFVRLRPPPNTDPATVEEWRADVAKVARAVRVVAPGRSALVPLSSDRSDEEVEVGSIREEAEKLAEETGEEKVVSYVKSVLDEVGA